MTASLLYFLQITFIFNKFSLAEMRWRTNITLIIQWQYYFVFTKLKMWRGACGVRLGVRLWLHTQAFMSSQCWLFIIYEIQFGAVHFLTQTALKLYCGVFLASVALKLWGRWSNTMVQIEIPQLTYFCKLTFPTFSEISWQPIHTL